MVNVCEPDSPAQFTAFIKDHPRVAKSIVQLRLRGSYEHPGPPMNATILTSILFQLPNLQQLVLGDMRYDGTNAANVDPSATTLAIGPVPNDRPFRLARFILGFDTHERSLLPEIFRIISLFEVEELSLGFSDSFDIASASDPFSLSLPLFVRSLEINQTIKSKEHAAVLFDALSAHLQPGVLRRLDVSVDSAGGIRGLQRLLSGAACSNLTYLDLKSKPQIGHYGLRYGWLGHKDPLQYEWPSLDLASCPRLESLVLHVYAQNPPSDMPLCSAAAGIFLQAPPTLRCATLKIWHCPSKNLVNAKWLGLQAVAKALSIPSRLLRLEKLTVQLQSDERNYEGAAEWYRATCEAAFSAVHAAGKLEVVRMRY
ncbi:hypothetical protein GSI_14821 [Ganoderma sinense ZZ0214-1]|uniref:F-box domain-containing protein n=1 Tax=Ganoderma sinense ZZ0214-1 TaxID=1077348 RepID=A0A2G8RPS1_9APHY|nr:hypothetical protein GSI_14821 [Ganoderma sinense ZZ0214-1]